MTVFALGVSILILGIAVRAESPWYVIAPVALALAMLVVAIILNPQSGSTLSAESLSFFHGGKEETILLADVATMKVSRWTDGPDQVTLHLKSGRVVDVPSLCADSKLVQALQGLGITE
jgi:hypothetical protein